MINAELSSLRFIFQPGVPGYSPIESQEFLEHTSRSLFQRIGVDRHKDRLCTFAFDYFFANISQTFGGNSLCWMGYEDRSDQSGNFKIYMNPWALDCPLSLTISNAIRVVEGGIRAYEYILKIQKEIGKSGYINLIGFNVVDIGKYSAKIYFIIPSADLSMVDSLISHTGIDAAKDTIRSLVNSAGNRGELHLSLRLPTANQQRGRAKFNFLAKDYFRNDEEALSFVHQHRQLDGQSKRIYWETRTLILRHDSDHRRQISFVGIGANKLDLYFVPYGFHETY